MKFLLVGLAIFVSLAVASEKIACYPEFCDLICENPPTEKECRDKDMEYRPNSSFCGCCATCVEYIPLEGDCSIEDKPQISVGFSLPKKHCRPGSQCIGHKCLIIMD